MKYIRANFLDNFIELAEERVPIVLKTYVELIPQLRVKTSDQRVIAALDVIMQSFVEKFKKPAHLVEAIQQASEIFYDSDIAFKANYFVNSKEAEL